MPPLPGPEAASNGQIRLAVLLGCTQMLGLQS